MLRRRARSSPPSPLSGTGPVSDRSRMLSVAVIANLPEIDTLKE
jgi:hypothetical protein